VNEERPKIWVEFRGGGPFDGTMTQLTFPLSGMVVYPALNLASLRQRHAASIDWLARSSRAWMFSQ
jgi:hypothetical protein